MLKRIVKRRGNTMKQFIALDNDTIMTDRELQLLRQVAKIMPEYQFKIGFNNGEIGILVTKLTDREDDD